MINKTEILTLKEVDGRFVVGTIPVEDCSLVVGELKAAGANQNKTLLDVQTLFYNCVSCSQ